MGNVNDVATNGIIAVLEFALAPLYPINATVSAFGAIGQDIVDSSAPATCDPSSRTLPPRLPSSPTPSSTASPTGCPQVSIRLGSF